MKLKSIKKVSHEKSRCITVSNPNGLYVTDDGIVTHNSTCVVDLNLYVATLFALMWAPYRYYGYAPSTQFTMVFGGYSQKKASELLLEPMMNVLRSSDYFQQCRSWTDMVKKQKEFEEMNDVPNIYFTTASPTSAIAFSNGLNVKVVSSEMDIVGQSQPLDCKILMADNTYKNMGDIKIGDKIASPSEGSQEVLSIYPQGKKKTYKITLADGRTTRCSPDHIWKIAWEKDKNGKFIWVEKPLQFIIDHPELDIELWDKDVADDLPCNY